jgi:hypothetical protein
VPDGLYSGRIVPYLQNPRNTLMIRRKKRTIPEKTQISQNIGQKLVRRKKINNFNILQKEPNFPKEMRQNFLPRSES